MKLELKCKKTRHNISNIKHLESSLNRNKRPFKTSFSGLQSLILNSQFDNNSFSLNQEFTDCQNR
jgi:hypothetical protein